MKQVQSVIVAYLVSWSTEPVYAEAVIKPDDANVNYSGRYDFTSSSAADFRYGYTISIKGIPWTSKKPIKMNKPNTAASRQPATRT